MSSSSEPSGTINPVPSSSDDTVLALKRQFTDFTSENQDFQREQRAKTEENKLAIEQHGTLLQAMATTLNNIEAKLSSTTSPNPEPIVAQGHDSTYLPGRRVQPTAPPVSQEDRPTVAAPTGSQSSPLQDTNDAFRRLTQREKINESGDFIPLDPLAKKLTDKPAMAEHLLIGAKGDSDNSRDIQIWQVGPFDVARASYEITQVADKGRWMPPTGRRPILRLTQVELKSSCALSYERATAFFNEVLSTITSSTRTTESVMPYPIRVTAVRMIWRVSSKKHAYKFIDQNRNTIDEVEVSTSPGGGGRDRDDSKEASSLGHTKNCQLSEQALAHMKTTNSHIRDLTGTLLLQSMLYRLSQAEKDEGVSATQCAKYTAACIDTAQHVLEWFLRCLSDWRTVSEAQALSNLSIKKSPSLAPKCPLPHANDVLNAWENYLCVLMRTFELTGPLYEHLKKLSTDMTTFLRLRTHTYPELQSNGFCLHYFNMLIQDFLIIMRDPNNSSQDIDDLISRLVISDDTQYYKIAFERVTRERLENLEKQVPNHSSNKGGNGKTGGRGGKSTNGGNNNSRAKASTPCFRSFTKKGCQFGDRCRFDHGIKTLTMDQKKQARQQYDIWNKKFPDEAPYEPDESKF